MMHSALPDVGPTRRTGGLAYSANILWIYGERCQRAHNEKSILFYKTIYHYTLLQKRSGNFRPPNRQRIRPSRHVSNRRLGIHQVAIGVVFDHIARDIPPVIEDLRSQHMTTHSPGRPISLLDQPLVA